VSDSIWKKEISLGRKKAKPQAEAPADSQPKQPKQSVWKKEISLGRKKAKPHAEAPPPHVALAPEPATAGAPSLPHAAGDYEWLTEPTPAPMPPNVVALPPAAVPAAEPPEALPAEPEKARKPSFLKRELGRSRAPREPKPPKEPKQPKQPKEPRAARPARVPRRPARGKQLVGLKIGASQIAAARVVNNGAAELVQVARADLRPGLVVGGELREPDALAEQLRDFFREHRLPRRSVRLGISNNRIGVRTFEIAGITEPKQLENAIRFRAQEALPIPIEEAVLDYRVLAEGTNDEGEPMRRILLVVAYRELVDRYVGACRKAGLTLAGIDLEAFALLRSLAAPRTEEDESDAALVAVAIGHERSTLAVSDGRVCEFTRVVEWGGAALNVAIARALDLSPPEAEAIKRALSLHASAPIDGLTPEQVQAVEETVRRQIHTFARELVSSLQFYQGQPGSLGIGEIVVTGGTAHLPGLAEELQKLIGVAVRLGDPLARVRVGKRVREHEQVGSLAVAIGLGIDD
jgi:type IV pilus assembly protein PilM